MLLAYLKSIGLTRRDVKMVHKDQAEILSAFDGAAGDVFVLWAPNTYSALARGGKVLANGRTVGSGTVPGALVAAPGFAREHPDLVARFLRVYFRAIDWQQANRNDAVDMLAAFNKQGGVTLDKQWLAEEFKTRPVWGVPGQLRIMARKDGKPSAADGWFTRVGEYFVAAGSLEAMPDPKTFITDEFMKMAATKLKP